MADNKGANLAPFLVLTQKQTAGRGRAGRKWESEDDGLYFSIYLRPSVTIDKAAMLTLVMAVAVAKALQRYIAIQEQTCKQATDGCESSLQILQTLGIKWPNDLVLNGKKIVGILTELRTDDRGYGVVIGVGVNTNQKTFPEELQDKATSLKREMGIPILGEVLLKYIEEIFLQEYTTFEKEGNLVFLKETYETLLINKDKVVRVLDPKGEYQGVAKGIDEVGQLLVETQDKEVQKVYAGEVSVRGLYGYVD
ncbi:MAG: biotin--[Lachnospiraceae bacterium]|nr:biotin--[acetyl-CoA-carboxylase] ligase [Lachnospiraceae bacterium]